MMNKHSDWEQRLLDWARGLEGTKVLWGATDCHALAVEALQLMYPVSPLGPTPRWSSLGCAVRLSKIWRAPDILLGSGARAQPFGFSQVGDIITEPLNFAKTRFQSVLVSLGREGCLTADPEDLVVKIAPNGAVCEGAVAWRWPVG